MNLKKKCKEMSFTTKVNMAKIPLFTEKDDFEKYMNSIRCGNTVHKPKKGKGSYKRNKKHKKGRSNYF